MVNTILESRASFVERGIKCRLCMNYHEYSFSIFDPNMTSGMELWSAIQDLLSLEVAEGDGLPDIVCRLCLKKLWEFSEFKEMCVNSAKELKRIALEIGIKTEVKEEVIPSESMFEEETYRGDQFGQDESQVRAMHNIVGEPLEMRNVRYIKEEVDQSESSAEDETCRGESLRENELRGRALNHVVCVPLEVGNLNDVKREVDPFESVVEEETYYGRENNGEDVAQEKPVSYATDVKEEILQGESLAEEGTYGGENLGEDECVEKVDYNVVCVPLETGNQVHDTSITRRIPGTHENILSNLTVKRLGNIPVQVMRKSNCIFDSPSHLLNNNPTEHRQPTESIGIIQGESFEAENFALGSRTNERRYLPQLLEFHKNYSSVNLFKCETCGKEFTRKVWLMNHSIAHSDFRPFKCETCGKGFKRSSHLRRHSQIHTQAIQL